MHDTQRATCARQSLIDHAAVSHRTFGARENRPFRNVIEKLLQFLRAHFSAKPMRKMSNLSYNILHTHIDDGKSIHKDFSLFVIVFVHVVIIIKYI